MLGPSPTGVATRPAALALLLLLALAGAACQSPPPAGEVVVDERSSMLAVEVHFPAFGRDPSLVRAWFVRGPIHAGLPELPPLVPATFVKDSRAYLLDPEPGTWSLVAVSAAVSPPRNRAPVAGVTDTVAAEGDIGTAYVLPGALIERTRATVAPGRAVFMGALTVEPDERVHALTFLEESLEQRLAEAVRPGSTYRTGLSAAFSRTWTVDPVATTFLRTVVEREAFLKGAPEDLGASPWAARLPAPPPDAERTALEQAWRGEPPPPAPAPPAPLPESVEQEPPAPPPPDPRSAPAEEPPAPAPPPRAEEPPAPSPKPAPAPPPAPVARTAPSPEPDAEPAPPPAPPPEIAPGSGSLDDVRVGMLHTRVREILGDPDDRSTRATLRAWIPFYSGPGTHERTWVYQGRGRVVFTVDSHRGTLRVARVIREGVE